jgi:hypothetical protein
MILLIVGCLLPVEAIVKPHFFRSTLNNRPYFPRPTEIRGGWRTNAKIGHPCWLHDDCRIFQKVCSFILETDDKSHREIVVQNYRVMYRLETSRVLFLAIMHGSRDISWQDKKPREEV